MPTPSNKDCLIKDIKTCQFKVSPNSKTDGAEPIYELSVFSTVAKHSADIDRVAIETGVDATLIRAIMYMETTHGYYDAPLSILGVNKSILPMNINVAYWGDTFGTRKDLQKPYENIKAGATILKRIITNLPKGSGVEQIATLYQNINASTVSNYGARVKKIYESKPWTERAPNSAPLTGAGSTIQPKP
ncbi:MAG TPA: hypothetical protein PLF25_03925 [Accumulibacter sp.]|nr:hypothetical protein [Accumulibacter sp.]